MKNIFISHLIRASVKNVQRVSGANFTSWSDYLQLHDRFERTWCNFSWKTLLCELFHICHHHCSDLTSNINRLICAIFLQYMCVKTVIHSNSQHNLLNYFYSLEISWGGKNHIEFHRDCKIILHEISALLMAYIEQSSYLHLVVVQKQL